MHLSLSGCPGLRLYPQLRQDQMSSRSRQERFNLPDASQQAEEACLPLSQGWEAEAGMGPEGDQNLGDPISTARGPNP